MIATATGTFLFGQRDFSFLIFSNHFLLSHFPAPIRIDVMIYGPRSRLIGIWNQNKELDFDYRLLLCLLHIDE